jgi:hypothetical protein
MDLKHNLFDLLLRLPVAGWAFRQLQLWRHHPMEWALIHRCHYTSSKQPSILHFSVNKSATQYVKSLLSRAGTENGMTAVHLHGYSFNSDFPFLDHLSVEEMRPYQYLFKPHGYVYSVFGGAIEAIPSMENYRTVLMIRDPRDVLTSMYYSSAYSHSVPEVTSNKRKAFLESRAHTRELTIDEFVLENAERERAIYQRYTDLFVKKQAALYLTRYEDMITDFDAWFKGLLAYCKLEVTPALHQTIFAEAQKIRPAKENIYSHVRKGMPGDYREKLRPKTVDALNQIFAQVLKGYRYDG